MSLLQRKTHQRDYSNCDYQYLILIHVLYDAFMDVSKRACSQYVIFRTLSKHLTTMQNPSIMLNLVFLTLVSMIKYLTKLFRIGTQKKLILQIWERYENWKCSKVLVIWAWFSLKKTRQKSGVRGARNSKRALCVCIAVSNRDNYDYRLQR